MDLVAKLGTSFCKILLCTVLVLGCFAVFGKLDYIIFNLSSLGIVHSRGCEIKSSKLHTAAMTSFMDRIL